LEFTPFQHNHQLHNSSVTLPSFLQLDNVTPYIIFSQFFSPKQIEVIVQNTNIYAYYHIAKSNGNNRVWKELTAGELKIWLALVIFMGVFKFPSVDDYWKTDEVYPSNDITKLMSLFCFQQISK